MAKYALRIKAREMRAKGESVRIIAKKLGVSKGTVSIWVRDIILTVDQYQKLKQQNIKGGELGRLKGAFLQKKRRLDLIEKYRKEGIEKFTIISQKERYTTGIALYWAEGSKLSGEVEFCNSDPKLINFMIRWLKEFFDVGLERLAANVGINEMHREREEKVKQYWSEITNVPLSQFRKTSFKRSLSKKVYSNYENHYGTLSIKVLKPNGLCYKILGLIEGLALSG